MLRKYSQLCILRVPPVQLAAQELLRDRQSNWREGTASPTGAASLTGAKGYCMRTHHVFKDLKSTIMG